VVKSQIHAGGRGKGKFKEASAGDKGGVRIAKSIAEVNEFAKQMLGATLVTVQTGPTASRSTGFTSRKAPTSTRSSISRSWSTAKPPKCRSWSPRRRRQHRGRAHHTPEKIVTFSVDPATGIMGITAAPLRRRWGCQAISPSRRKNWWRSSMPPSSPRTWRCSKSIRWS